MNGREYRQGSDVDRAYDDEYDVEPSASVARWPGRRTLVEVEAARRAGRRPGPTCADARGRGPVRLPEGLRLGTATLAREPLPGAARPEGAPPAAVRQALEHEGGSRLAPELVARLTDDATSAHGARIVTGPRAERAAAAIGARAFTVGDRIFFAAGAYAPGTSDGDELLRHELTHVAQQDGAAMPAIDDLRVTAPSDASEVAASAAAAPTAAASATAAPTAAVAPAAVEIAPQRKPASEDDPRATLDLLEVEVVAALLRQLGTARLATGDATVAWRSGTGAAFVLATLAPVTRARVSLWDHLTAVLATTGSAEVVGRGLRVTWRSSPALAIATELRMPYLEALRDALERVVPRWLALQASDGGREPAPGRVLASHPCDPIVATALAGMLVDVPGAPARAPAARPAQVATSQLRPVQYGFELERGLRWWIRVESPEDVSPEEVARALYADEKLATTLRYRVGRRFAFEAARLRGDARSRFMQTVEQDRQARAAARARLPASQRGIAVETSYFIDPLAQLGSLDLEALAAEALPAPSLAADPFEVLSQLRLALFPLEQAEPDAAQFGAAAADGVRQARHRLEQRSQRLSAAAVPPAEVTRWAAQTARQLDVVVSATQGLAQAASYLRQLAGGQRIRLDLLPLEVGALLGPIGRGYASAAAHADLPDLGGAELARADALSQSFAFDQLEQELRGARRDQRAVQAGQYARKGDQPRLGDDLAERRVDELRDRLADARERALGDPGTADPEVSALQREVGTVRGQTSAAVNRERADQLIAEMRAHLTLIGAFTGKNSTLRGLGRWYQGWSDKWAAVQVAYLGSREAGDRALDQLRQDRTFEQGFEVARGYVQDKEKFERWVKLVIDLGVTLGLMGVSAGTAALARGALVAGGWSALPLALEAGTMAIEAGTFTTLSAIALGEDKTLGDLFLDFVGNVAMFGVLRGVGAASQGNLLVEFEALFAIEAGKHLVRGGELTPGKAVEIGAHTLAMMVGSKLLMRWGQGLMAQLEATGAGIGAEWAAYERERKAVLRLARDVKVSKSPALARRALARQAELLRRERALIDAGTRDLRGRVGAGGLAGLHAMQTRLHGQRGANLAEQVATERARIALELRQVTPTQYLCKKGQLTRAGRPGSLAERLRAIGDGVTLQAPDPATGARAATVEPRDGSRAYRIIEDVSAADAAKWRQRRVDMPPPEPTRGTSDLHNHVLGVPDLGFWIEQVGDGDAKRLLGRAVRAMAERPKRGGVALRQQLPETWAAAQEAMRKLAALPARQRSGPAGEAIARDALRKIFGASDSTPFDHAYEIRDALIKKHLGYEAFMDAVIESLAAEGVDYSEQSVSLKKLVGADGKGDGRVFDEQMMNRIRERMARRGAHTDLRFLGMVNTSALTGKMSGKELASTRAQVDAALERGDTIGLDIAGPEKDGFSAQGMKNFESLYQQVAAAAARRGRPLVLRPHVGEGYQAGDAQHATTARENLQLLITQLQSMGYSPAKAAQDGVIIRFGHATHATEAQLVAIRDLGIYVEANIGSNLATKSIPDVARHPLLLALYHQTPMILSTDGQGVMGTKLGAEYEKARVLIDRFRAGDLSIVVGGKPLSFSELRPGERSRFDIEVLLGWEREYRAALVRADEGDARRRK